MGQHKGNGYAKGERKVTGNTKGKAAPPQKAAATAAGTRQGTDDLAENESTNNDFHFVVFVAGVFTVGFLMARCVFLTLALESRSRKRCKTLER